MTAIQLAKITELEEKEVRELIKQSLVSAEDLGKWYLAIGRFPTRSQQKLIRQWGINHVLRVMEKHETKINTPNT